MSMYKNNRRGAVMVQVALCLTAMLGVAALSLDGGLLLDQRRHAQDAADAAALAGAANLYTNYRLNNGADKGGAAKSAALAFAAANGCTNDGKTSVVTVNIPPQSGSFVKQPGYVEVIVQANVARCFSAVFGSGNIPVTARAVARGLWTSPLSAAGLIALGPSGVELDAVGNASLNVTNGSVLVDSNSGSAITAKGSNTSLTATNGFDVTGGVSDPHHDLSGTVNTGVQATPDPLMAIPPAPDPSSLSVQSSSQLKITGGGTVTLNPGVYVGGISITGLANVVLQPGIYYMEGGGFSDSGQGSLTGSQVMIYNGPANPTPTPTYPDGDPSTVGSISLTGQGAVTLSPPTSGLYQGLTFFQERAATAAMTLTGNGAMNITGTLYAESGSATISGNGDTIGSQLIAYGVTLKGNGALNIAYNSNSVARNRYAGLVE